PSLYSRVWKKIIKLEVPSVTATSGINTGYTSRELPILCCVGMLKNLYRLNRVDRQVQTKVSAGRIGSIKTIDQQCTLLFAGAFDTDLSCCRTNNSWNQRQSFVHAARCQGQSPDIFPLKRTRCC